ncbi:uncharacterized protein LOC142334621 [Convolutriloba macropyga]|uniref:uncharacterized protein LOC142334621 n=1 Tax=Convolutriloba macropyga TaxID=536237 RepID=UPI003F528648
MDFARKTCDQLSRDVMKHVLAEFHSTDWHTFIHDPDPEYANWFTNCFKRHCTPFSATTPSLEECDTTTLFEIFDQQVSVGVSWDKVKKFKDKFKMKEIKEFRNECAHAVKMLSNEEYERKFDKFYFIISQFDPKMFPSLDECLEYLRTNRNQTFDHFCRINPDEITLFVRNLESNLLEIAKRYAALKEQLEDLDRRISETTKMASETSARVDKIEQILEERNELKMPKSKVRSVHELAGRDDDLKKVSDYFTNFQLVSIWGPPGVGKTSLALAYAKVQQKIDKADASESNKSVYLFVENFKNVKEGMSDVDIKREIGTQVASLFPGLSAALSETKDPFNLLLQHVETVVTDRRLFFIFDNIDTVLAAQDASTNVVGDIIEELTARDENIRILTTSRDKRLQTEYIDMEIVELKPISSNDCRQWMQSENRRQKISEELIDAIAECCSGIPLILNILHSAARRRRVTSVDQLESVKRSDDWNRLKRCLELSFELLTPVQTQLMKCASVFSNNFEEHTLAEMIYKLHQKDESVSDVLLDCHDLSLVEYDDGADKYFLHPYIQEHIYNTKIVNMTEMQNLEAMFVATYFEKMLKVAEDQLKKDSFATVLSKVVIDCQNFEKLFKLVSSQNHLQVKCFEEFVRGKDNFSPFWLLTCFTFLDLIGRFKNSLLRLAHELELIFQKTNMTAHEVMCKCFMAHKYRLMTGFSNLARARSKINEASNMSNSMRGPMKKFCLGYTEYLKGRFNQQTRTGSLAQKWRKNFNWENISAYDHLSSAAEQYLNWEPEPQLIDTNRIVTARDVELYRCLVFQCRERLDNAQTETEKNDCFHGLDRCVQALSQLLGPHQEVAYAAKKHADNLKHYGRKVEASDRYAQVYKMFELLGPEIKTQQIVVLKEWSDCDDNKADALKKLRKAEAILIENSMQDHSWYRTVQARIRSCLESLEPVEQSTI